MITHRALMEHAHPFYHMMDECQNGIHFKDFIERIQKESVNSKDPLKLKGDYFELFAQIFFNIYESDNSVGLRNYTPIPINEDYGVDGIGTNVIGNKVAVQVKFRSNPCDLVTYEEVSKTDSAGRRREKLNLDIDNSIYVFTSSNDVTNQCKDIFGSSLRVINRHIICAMVSNNLTFWRKAYDEVYTSLS